MSEKFIKSSVIIAPHPDDEIIGTYEELSNKDNHIVIIYGHTIEAERREEALSLKSYFSNIKAQLFQNTVPQPYLQKTNKFFFPDPIYETHPEHRQWGYFGEQLAREGFNVIFYSTIMTAPYIHKVKNPEKKKEALDKNYPSQMDLWKYDHKYFLFEGKCRWIF